MIGRGYPTCLEYRSVPRRVRPPGGFTRPFVLCTCGATCPVFHWYLLGHCPGCKAGTVVLDSSPPVEALVPRARTARQQAACRRNIALGRARKQAAA